MTSQELMTSKVATIAEKAIREWESWVRDQLEGTDEFEDAMWEIHCLKIKLVRTLMGE